MSLFFWKLKQAQQQAKNHIGLLIFFLEEKKLKKVDYTFFAKKLNVLFLQGKKAKKGKKTWIDFFAI